MTVIPILYFHIYILSPILTYLNQYVAVHETVFTCYVLHFFTCTK